MEIPALSIFSIAETVRGEVPGPRAIRTLQGGLSARSFHDSRRYILSKRIAVFASMMTYGVIVDPKTGNGGIPCLWKFLLGVDCPGCGLSRAGAFLLRGHLLDAARMNWLIFPVALILTWALVIQPLVEFLSANPEKLSYQKGS